jgi:hypothetical protein
MMTDDAGHPWRMLKAFREHWCKHCSGGSKPCYQHARSIAFGIGAGDGHARCFACGMPFNINNTFNITMMPFKINNNKSTADRIHELTKLIELAH